MQKAGNNQQSFHKRTLDMRWQIGNKASIPKLAMKWNENSQIAFSNDPVFNNTRFVFGKIAIHSEEKKEQIIIHDSSRKIGVHL